MVQVFLEGFFLQASLILALGAQNIFVLESGLKRQHHFLVASLCIFLDYLLVFIGVWGAAEILLKFPILKITVGICGVGFLIFYAFQKIREGFGRKAFESFNKTQVTTRKKAILAALGFTLLNPHVYLDTIVLIGGFSSKYSDFEMRTAFGFGAGTLSLVWFYGLVIVSSFFNKLLHNERAMRVISLMAGIVLLFIGYKLGVDVYSWVK